MVNKMFTVIYMSIYQFCIHLHTWNKCLFCTNYTNINEAAILHFLIYFKYVNIIGLFVCVEVLRPCQPNGVISSTVSLPNHTFTGQT